MASWHYIRRQETRRMAEEHYADIKAGRWPRHASPPVTQPETIVSERFTTPHGTFNITITREESYHHEVHSNPAHRFRSGPFAARHRR